MERCGQIYLAALFGLADSLQRVSLPHTPHVHLIALFYYEVGDVLHPYVGTKRLFAATLQGRAVNTIDAEIVLPRDIVSTLWIEFPEHIEFKSGGFTLGDGKFCLAMRLDRHIHQQLAVVRLLVRLLLTQGVPDNQRGIAGGAK